ncbi:ExbD/TolR family protein [Gilvimarinus polysaccharolyticus]
MFFILFGDKSVAYEDVVKTMTAIQQAGITKLGFVTEPSR